MKAEFFKDVKLKHPQIRREFQLFLHVSCSDPPKNIIQRFGHGGRQPTPPQRTHLPPRRNKALLTSYQPLVSLHKAKHSTLKSRGGGSLTTAMIFSGRTASFSFRKKQQRKLNDHFV